MIAVTSTRLSRDVVIAAARRLAERDGLSGLSMRRLAEELGVSTMAAYRHVPSKEAIVREVLRLTLEDAAPRPDCSMDPDPVLEVLDAVVVTWQALERISGLRAELGDLAACPVTASWARSATAPVEALVGPRLLRLQEALVALLVGCSSVSSVTWSARVLLAGAVVR